MGQKGKRQGAGVGPVAAGYPDCTDVGNAIESCFPRSDTVLVEDHWSKFIWNVNHPQFIAAGTIDAYLWRAGPETLAASFLGIPTARGLFAIQPDDRWWPPQQTYPVGRNVSQTFYFVVVVRSHPRFCPFWGPQRAQPGGTTLTGGEPHQATFTAVQTRPPATLLASIASASASIASASAAAASSLAAAAAATAAPSSVAQQGLDAALSSLSAAIAASRTTLDPSASSSFRAAQSSLAARLNRSDDSGSSLPAWAIALIVVFGGIMLLALLLLAACFFCFARRRRRNSRRDSEADRAVTEPMLQAEPRRTISSEQPRPAASSLHGPAEGSALSGADAAVMAEAFRKALRQPEFPPTDPSPSSRGSQLEQPPDPAEGQALMQRELALEGRRIDSVPDLKAVQQKV